VIDPRLRQRVEIVPVRPGVRNNVTNAELLDTFSRTVHLAKPTLTGYLCSIRDALNYMRKPDGEEIPLRNWTKADIWAHLHFVEANYCGSFRPMPFIEEHAVCRRQVWLGSKPAAVAARENCQGCPLFTKPMVSHRVNALSKFFKFLAKIGAVPFNIMADVVSEFWEEDPIDPDDSERRRNPTVEEQVRLVNETAHAQRRAFYACSAKWWFRPNEMFLLDRYASFGLPMPKGLPMPRGFEEGFRKHPHVKAFDEGGDMVYIPFKTKPNGERMREKRKGNRWSVIDAELRPILEQHLAWWESKVRRDKDGVPLYSTLWLSDRGTPLVQGQMYRTLFTDDCLRLGLMTEKDLRDPLRVWTCHCQRHFGEQVCEMHDVPDNWSKHFRGDLLKDARKKYFRPKPEEVRQKYHEFVPILGFMPLPNAPRMGGGKVGESLMHETTLLSEIDRMSASRRRLVQASSVELVSSRERFFIPRRVAAALLFALRISRPQEVFELAPDPESRSDGREFAKDDLTTRYKQAIQVLRAGGPASA